MPNGILHLSRVFQMPVSGRNPGNIPAKPARGKQTGRRYENRTRVMWGGYSCLPSSQTSCQNQPPKVRTPKLISHSVPY